MLVTERFVSKENENEQFYIKRKLSKYLYNSFVKRPQTIAYLTLPGDLEEKRQLCMGLRILIQ